MANFTRPHADCAAALGTDRTHLNIIIIYTNVFAIQATMWISAQLMGRPPAPFMNEFGLAPRSPAPSKRGRDVIMGAFAKAHDWT